MCICIKQAQVSSLNMEKQQLSFELDKHKQMENTNKSTGTGSCFHKNSF